VLSEVEADAALAGGEGLTDFDKILFEAKVYIKYRLFEHALEHVRTALRQQPEHVGAMTVQARAYAELGRTAEAADTHLAVAELVASRDPKLAREQLAAARELAPQHPHLDAVARILGPAAGPGRVAITSRRAPVEDDGDSGAFDLVSSGFDHADLDADLDADLSPPGIALDLDGEAAASLVPVEDVEHSTQPFKPIDFSREPSSPVPPSEHTPAVGFVPVRPPETRGPRRRLGPSVELPLEPEVTPTPAQTGRTLAPYPMDEPPAQTGQTLLHRRGPASGRRLVQEDDELEPARSGRTLVHEPEPARSGRTLVHEPEPARSGRTLVQMPIVDEDGEAVSTDPLEGLDFGGEDDVEVEATDMLGDAGGGDAGVGPDASLIDVEIEVEESVVTTPPAAEAREWADLSDELDEIQFYVDQGLDEDAVVALVDLELQYPGNPQINEFRVRVLGQAPAVAPVAATSTAIHDEELAPLAEPSASLDDEGIEAAETMLDFDIDEAEAEVEAEAAEPLVSLDEEPAEAGEPLVSFDDDDDEDAYLSAIFADPVKKPKAKPRTDDSNPGANLAAGQSVDAATAFDLGVAYREMGLVDAAIAQFETAARDPQWRARALTLLGALRVHRGETDRAIADLKDAVRLASTPAEASEAAYELGVLYEVIGDSEAAIQQLLTVAPGYRDRDERLAELGF
jgi:tetratricopeptide (TPR) repeat protein